MKDKISKQDLRVCIVGPFPPPPGGMAIQAEELARRLSDEGYQVYQVKANPSFPVFLMPFSRIKGLRTLIRLWIFLLNLLRALRRVDVVHILSASYLSFWLTTCPAVVIGRIYGKRVVVNYHGGFAEDFFSKWMGIAKGILGMASVITVPSQFLETVFAKFGFETIVVPNIVDFQRFEYIEHRAFRPRFVMTRHLEKVYNIGCGIRAFEIVKRRYPEAELSIAGSGSEEGELRSLAQGLNLRDVTFLGEMEQSEIANLYRENDVFINSSNRDNMPISLLEAFAAGLPVVTTNAGGIPYLIEDGETGFLVDLDDHKEMAARMMQLLESPDLAHRMAKNARETVKQYSWEMVKEKLIAAYCEGGT